MKKNKKQQYEKLELTIERSRWLNGSKYNFVGGALCARTPTKEQKRENQHKPWAGEDAQCCLGHLATKLGGVTQEQLKEWDAGFLYKVRNMLAEAGKEVPEPIRRVLHYNENRFIEINDSSFISDATRELRLKKLFREVGIEVTFK